MSNQTTAVRTYLISYVITAPYGVGRFFNDRDTDTAPSREDIESMESKLSVDHSAKVMITSVSRIEAGEVKP